MDRIFLDANVLFSVAYKPDSVLLQLWKLEHVALCTSDYAVEEAVRNLDESHVPGLKKLLQEVDIVSTIMPQAFEIDNLIKLRPKDQPILYAALQAKATHLLTGDIRDFGAYFGQNIAGILILRPVDYLVLKIGK